jgi:DNA helicase-2/ATP-dependent DNA helicase PcrA
LTGRCASTKRSRRPEPSRSRRPHVLKVTATPGSWDDEVVAFLRALQESGRLDDWNQVTFLFRSVRNKEVLRLARRLEGEGIPVYSPRSNLFFERDEVRWMIGALIMLFPQFDNVVRAPWKGEHPEVFDWYENSAAAFLDAIDGTEHADLRKWMGYRRREHGGLAEETDYAFSGLFYQLLAFPIFANFVDGTAAHDGVRNSRAARNLATVSRLLTRFESWHGMTVLSPRFIESNLRNLFANYLRFLFDGGIDEFEDETDFAPPGCVSFMTIHQAKGFSSRSQSLGCPRLGRANSTTTSTRHCRQRTTTNRPWSPWSGPSTTTSGASITPRSRAPQDLLVLTTPERLEGAGRRVPCSEFQDLVCGTPSWRQHADNLAHTGLSRTARADIKARYSFTSHITVFENCARQYEFFKDLEFTPVRSNAIIFGTLVHQTIEDVHKAVLHGQTGHLQPEAIEAWLRDNYRSLSRRERRYLSEPAIRSALGHVLRYVEGRAGAWGDVLATEIDVSLVRDTYILSGSIDLLQGDGDTLEVVDFKSEPKPDLVRDADRLLRYRRQLEIYGQLVSKRTGKRVSKLHLHYTGCLHGNPRISYDMDPLRVERTIRGFDDVVARIEANDFEIHERPDHLCKNCDLKPYCDRKGTP